MPENYDANDVAKLYGLEAIRKAFDAREMPWAEERAPVEAYADEFGEPANDDDDSTFELLDIGEMEALPPPTWLVHEAIAEEGLTVIYGEPGAGKSFIALDMALRVAAGAEWFGRKTKRTGVLYIAAEGARGMGKRITGWKIHNRCPELSVPFFVLPVAVQLLEDGERAKLLRTIDEAKRQLLDFDIGLVIVDTVSRSIAGIDENSQDTMTRFVDACDSIKRHCGGALIGIHHSGKDKERGMRGSSVLLGAVDASIRLTKKDHLVTIAFEKQKDAEEAAPFYVELEKVRWFPDRDHTTPEDEVSTLVPVRAERPKEGADSISMDQIRNAFGMMADAWISGLPLSNKPQTRTDGRYAPLIFKRKLGGDANAWQELIAAWLEGGNLIIDVADKKTKKSGLRVMEAVL